MLEIQRPVTGASGFATHPSSSETRRRWGLARALYATIMVRAERWLGLRVFRVRERPLVPLQDLPPLPEGWTLRQISIDELRSLAQDPMLQLDGTFIDSTAAITATMTGVFDRDQLVSYAFATTGTAPAADGMWVSCRSPYRYSFKSFTRPEYRGRRLSTYTSLASDSIFLSRGFTHAISYTETHNFASIRTELSKGNSAIGVAGYLKTRRLCFVFRSPGCRRAGFCFYRMLPERSHLGAREAAGFP